MREFQRRKGTCILAAVEISQRHKEEFPLFGKVDCQRITVPEDGSPLQLDAAHVGDEAVPGHFVVPGSVRLAGEPRDFRP